MQPVDEFGFPKRADFDNEEQEQATSSPRGGRRYAILLMAIFCSGLLALCVHFASHPGGPGMPEILNDLEDMMGTSPRAILHRYVRNMRRKDFDQALADAEQMIEKVPRAGYFLKGQTLQQMGRHEESIESYTHALDLGCHDPATAYNNRAYARAMSGRELDLALQDVEEALKLNRNAAFVDTRGFIYYLLGEPEKALADFNSILAEGSDLRATERRPEALGEIYFHRALVYEFLGESHKADKDFLDAKIRGYTIEDYPKGLVPRRPPKKAAKEKVI